MNEPYTAVLYKGTSLPFPRQPYGGNRIYFLNPAGVRWRHLPTGIEGVWGGLPAIHEQLNIKETNSMVQQVEWPSDWGHKSVTVVSLQEAEALWNASYKAVVAFTRERQRIKTEQAELEAKRKAEELAKPIPPGTRVSYQAGSEKVFGIVAHPTQVKFPSPNVVYAYWSGKEYVTNMNRSRVTVEA